MNNSSHEELAGFAKNEKTHKHSGHVNLVSVMKEPIY